MSIVHAGRLGWVNPANVSKVFVGGGVWHHYGRKPHASRKYIWWGKPYIERDSWAWYERPFVAVRLVGKEYPLELDCETRGEADRLCADLIGVLNAGADLPERIVAAAVRRYDSDRSRAVHDERIYVPMTYTMPAPAMHPNILHAMPEDPTPLGGVHDVVQGFLTNTGRFVTRTEAMGIAVHAGQVDPSKYRMPTLFSEDLW